MKRYCIEIKIKGAHVVQPSSEVRKLDHEIVLYKRLVVRNGKEQIVYSPIPPESFKGALRHAAYVAAKNLNLLGAYENLFGYDVSRKSGAEDSEETLGELSPLTKESRISISLVEGLTCQQIEELVEERPRIRIDRSKGSVKEEALAFTSAISEEFNLKFELIVDGELSGDEEKLLKSAVNLLKGWAIGGWSSLGFGLVEDVKFEEGDSSCQTGM